MTTPHLTDGELDALLAGEPLAGERAVHARDCAACARRHDAFLAAVHGAGSRAGSEEAAGRAVAAALSRWRRDAPSWWWSLPAAAALVVAAGLGTWLQPVSPPPLDQGAVLAEVDALLAQDPVALVAAEDLLDLLTEEPPANST